MNDLRLAVRRLVRRPGFTLAVVATLALGIGATVAVFTVYDALFFRPLPYPEADRLVRLSRAHPTARFDMFSYPDLRDARAGLETLDEAAGWAGTRVPLHHADGRELVPGAWVTEGFFAALGTSAHLGRLFIEDDFASDSVHAAVLSYDLWRARYGADSAIVGRALTVRGRPVTILGILAPNPLQYPDPEIGIWLPASGNPNQHRGSRFLQAIGRLAPATTIDDARSEADLLAGRLAEQFPDENADRGIRVLPLRDDLVGDVRPLLRLLLGAVVVILIIACANVSNLLLARAMGRQRDFAVQRALGGGRRRVLRQVLAEGMVLAVLGAAAAVVTAAWTVDLFLALLPDALPRQGEIAVDLRILGVGLGLGIGTGLLASLIPAWRATRHDPAPLLKAGQTVVGAVRSRRRMQRGLVVVQCAATTVLLVAGGVLLKSFWQLQQVDLGFEPEGVAVASFSLSSDRYPDNASVFRFVDVLRERLEGRPEVDRVGVATMLPLSGDRMCHGIGIPGREVPREVCIQNRSVDAAYLPVIGASIRRGRGFTTTDGERGDPVAVVDETMAARYWAGEDPLGKKFTLRGQEWRIVGVVAGARAADVAEEPVPTVYVPFRQDPSSYFSVVTTGTASVAHLLPLMRGEIRALDPDALIFRVTPFAELYAAAIAEPRFRMSLIAGLALLALVVAAIGMYGVIAYDAADRTPEFGLRMALGASAGDVLNGMVAQAVALAFGAALLGVVGAAAVTRTLRSFLFNVEPLDPLVVAAVVVVLVAIMMVAALVPALRAARVDPMVALRYE